MTKVNGFTLIELLVTIVIAIILMTVGVPSLTSLYDASRSDSGIRTIQSSLTLARSQAVSYGANVTLCPLKSNTCSNNWINGFTIFIDGGTRGSFDGDDQIIKVVDAFNSKDFVSHGSNAISFSADGLVISGAGQISYCPSNKTNSNSKAASISSSGMVKLSSATNITCS